MSPSVPGFGAMRAKALKKLLIRQLDYTVVRQNGSHCTMKAKGRPQLVFSFHDGDTIGPVLVRKILVRDVGLTEEKAKEVYRRA